MVGEVKEVGLGVGWLRFLRGWLFVGGGVRLTKFKGG